MKFKRNRRPVSKGRQLALKLGTVAALGGALVSVQGAGASVAHASHHASKAPIVVGAISWLSGGSVFGASNQGAAAYFNYVNKHGGIDGRKIKYVALDDANSPSTAGQDARQLVSDGAVAVVGGESLLECGVNEAYFAKAGIIDSPQGTDIGCFSGPNEAPINYGPFVNLDIDLLYASKVLHDKHLCVITSNGPGAAQADGAAIAKFQAESHMKLAYYTLFSPTTSDFSPYAIAAKDHNCDYVYITTLPASSVSFMNDLATQGVSGINVQFPQPDYTQSFVAAIPKTKPGAIVDDEYAPYTDHNIRAVRRFIEIEQQNGGVIGDGAEGGYAAANLFVTLAKSIKGPITRASILKAYKDARNVPIPLLGSNWSFGHKLKIGSYTDNFLQDVNGKWVPRTGSKGFTVPSSSTVG